MNQYEQGRWDMFIEMQNFYYGKQYYFLQDDGTVYSRQSGKYLTIEGAYREFQRVLED
jgi:hypothetical protein